MVAQSSGGAIVDGARRGSDRRRTVRYLCLGLAPAALVFLQPDFGTAFLKPNVRKRFPCFVLMPQANGSWVQNPVFEQPIRLTNKPAASLAMAHEIVKSLIKKHPVDAARLYLMGYSNGSCGVWELLEREPRVWAAAAPMAGAGDPAHVGAAKNVAIWAFHGDTIVRARYDGTYDKANLPDELPARLVVELLVLDQLEEAAEREDRGAQLV